MPDVETPVVTPENEKLPVPVRTAGSMLERWVESGTDQALDRINALISVLEKLRQASIKATYPSDWIIHTSRAKESGEIIRQVGYLQDCGAERAGKPWGIEVGAPAIEREDFPDGTYCYHMLAEAWSKVTGERCDYVEGSRWSGDRFFARSLGPDEKVDPTDVRKAAYANLHGRAVRAIAGLNAVPLDMLRAAGIDIARVVHVNYEQGAKGGESTGATVGSADVKVAFGRSAGKTPGELEDKDLDWYIGAYAENVGNPEKAKFIKANQRVLDALKAEKERRAHGQAHEEATGTTAPAGTPAGEREDATPIGKKRGTLWTLLQDVAGKDATGAVKAAAKETFGRDIAGLSDLTEAELDKLLAMGPTLLKTFAPAPAAAGKGK